MSNFKPFGKLPDGYLDLRLGEPEIMQEHWRYAILPKLIRNISLRYQQDPVERVLAEQIYKIHQVVGNIENLGQYKLLVTSGATQALWAISDVLGTGLYNPPYYPRMKDIDNSLNKKADKPYFIDSYPNNPTGEIMDPSDLKVVDACYHWPQYYSFNDKMVKLNNEVIVFSLAKLSGHASTRLGWVLVKDEGLFNELNTKIEWYTGGVSFDAQYKAAQVIANLVNNEWFFTKHKVTLNDRHFKLDKILGTDKLSKRGMFLWTINNVNRKLAGVSGNAFGLDNNFVRYNIACTEAKFRGLLKELEVKYE
jgi:hypothetical protein